MKTEEFVNSNPFKVFVILFTVANVINISKAGYAFGQ